MTVAGQAAIQDGINAKNAAAAQAAASGSTSYSYYDRGILKQVNVPSTQEKLLSAAVQTGQGFGSLGGTTVEERSAYAAKLGFSPTEIKTATGELPYGSRRAEKQEATREALQRSYDQQVLNDEQKKRLELIEQLRAQERGQAGRGVLTNIGQQVPQGVGFSVFNLPQRTRAVQETFTPAFAKKAAKAEEEGQSFIFSSAFGGKAEGITDDRTPDEIAFQQKKFDQRNAAFGLPPTTTLGTRKEAVVQKEKSEAEKTLKDYNYDIGDYLFAKTIERGKSVSRGVKAMANSRVKIADLLTGEGRAQFVEEAKNPDIQNVFITGVDIGSLLVTGGAVTTFYRARQAARVAEVAREARFVEALNSIRKVTILETAVPIVETGAKQVAKSLAPQVAKSLAPQVARSAPKGFVKGAVSLLATPQAVAESYAIQRFGVQGVALPAIKEKYGSDTVKVAQEVLNEQLAGRNQDIFKRDELGRAIEINKDVGFFAEVKANPTFKGITEAAGRSFKYGFVGQLPLGSQAISFFSPSYRAETERIIRQKGTERGLKGAELDVFVKQVSNASFALQGTEAVGTVAGVERVTERLGLKTIGGAFARREGLQLGRKEVARKLFGLVAPKFAVEGAIEGGAQYGLQLKTRGGEATVKGAVVSILGGAVISTAIGASAVASSATRPRLSKGLNVLGQSLEFPYEYLGDVTAAQQVKLVRRLGGEVLEPAIKPLFNKALQTEVRAGTKVVSQSAAESFELLVQGRKGLKPRITTLGVGSPSLQFGSGLPASQPASVASVAKAQSKTNAQTKNAVKSIVEGLQGTPTTTRAKGGFGVSTPSPITQPIKSKEQVTVEEEIKQKINPDVKVDEPVEITEPIKQKITTPIDVLANVNIPINTNVFGLRGMLPPLPLPFPMGSGGYGAGSSKKIFKNELLASQQLFKQQISFGIPNLTRKEGQKSKKVKGKQQGRKESRSLLAQQLNFGVSNLFRRGKK